MERGSHTRSGRGERGKASIRGLVSLLLIGSLAYGAFKVIPPYAAAFQLDDEVREQVVLAGARRRKLSDEEIRRNLLQRAATLGVPLDERDIVIRRIGDNVRIELEYTVRLEFPLDLHYDWQFESTHEGPSF